jgi:hypothetical protein
MKNLTNNTLTIDDFEMTPYLISIQWHQAQMQENETLEVCRSCFEQWLHDSGRLNWVTDTTDHHGYHLQNNGTMAAEEYWLYADLEQKTEDLKAFIIAEVKAQEMLD